MNSEQKDNPKKIPQKVTSVFRYADIGFRMAVMIALGAWLGHWLDAKQQLERPIFTIIFSLLFIFAAIYWVIKDLTSK